LGGGTPDGVDKGREQRKSRPLGSVFLSSFWRDELGVALERKRQRKRKRKRKRKRTRRSWLSHCVVRVWVEMLDKRVWRCGVLSSKCVDFVLS
jgi:hypothetical protein